MSEIQNDEYVHAAVAFDGDSSHLYVNGKEVERTDGISISLWFEPGEAGGKVLLRALEGGAG